MAAHENEQALRYALKFFEDEGKWEHKNLSGTGLNGSLCIGAVLMRARATVRHEDAGVWGWDGVWLSKVLQLGKGTASVWNDTVCPDIEALRRKLKSRIAYYEQERLRRTYIAVVILGPGQNVRRVISHG